MSMNRICLQWFPFKASGQLHLGVLSIVTVYTLPVDPNTLNSSRNSPSFLLLSIMKNLCSLTLSTRSKMFCGHFALNFAPRFSGTGALGSFFFRPFGGTWLELGPADDGWDELAAALGCDDPEGNPRDCARVEGNVNSSFILFTAFRWRFVGGAVA